MTEEEVKNIKLSGTIETRFNKSVDGYAQECYGYFDIPSQIASWFTGEVVYID